MCETRVTLPPCKQSLSKDSLLVYVLKFVGRLTGRCRSVVVRERDKGCLPLGRKIRLGCGKHNGERFTNLPQKYHICYGLNAKKGRICVA